MSLTATDRLEVIDSPTDVHPSQPSQAPVEQGPALDVDPSSATTRPTFTITDAATACSVSRKTITRKLPELAGHGAAKDDDGVWRIPVEALLAVGLHPGRSLSQSPAPVRPTSPVPASSRPADLDTVTIPRDRWDDVRIRLARAEAEASERGLALADARLALRALTAGPSARPAPGPAPDMPVAAPHAGERTSLAEVPGEPAPHSPSTQISAPASPVAVEGSAVAGVHDGDAPTEAITTPGSQVLTAPGDDLPVDVVAARNLAARTGGYVPAVAAPAKKRRWWQSR